MPVLLVGVTSGRMLSRQRYRTLHPIPSTTIAKSKTGCPYVDTLSHTCGIEVIPGEGETYTRTPKPHLRQNPSNGG